MSKKNKFVFPWLIAAAAGFIVCSVVVLNLFGVLFTDSVSAQADEDLVGIQAGVGNVAPSIVSGSVHLNDGSTNDPVSITLVEEDSSALWCKFTVSDDNGCEDIDAGAHKVYIGTAGDSPCVNDAARCYTGVRAPCTLDAACGVGDTEASFTCKAGIPTKTSGLRFYAVNSMWDCYVIPVDESSAEGAYITSTSTTVNELLAFRAKGESGTYPGGDYINFGSLAYDGSESAQKTIEISNTGNVSIDTWPTSANDADPQTMACTTGALSVNYVNFSATDGFTWYSRTADDPVNDVYYLRQFGGAELWDLNMAVTNETQDLAGTFNHIESYWKLKLPTSAWDYGEVMGGTCSDGIRFEITSGSAFPI
jgi:hypothetical protein